MKSGETKRYPFQDQDKRTYGVPKTTGTEKTIRTPIKTEKYSPEQKQILIEVFQDIERLTKGRDQLSKKELIQLKKKYLDNSHNGNKKDKKSK